MSLFIEHQEIVVPGQKLAEGEYKGGDGTFQEENLIYSSYVGLALVRDKKINVRPLKGNYLPAIGDMVIGYIEDVMLTSWIVNIDGPYSGVLLASNAIRGRFDPIRDDARRIYDTGDVIRAEIISFDRTRDPQLVTKYQGLGKLRGGRVLETNPNHIPRIIGKKGSMISMIKRTTNCKIIVARNGRVWIKGENPESEEKVIQAINQISREAHVSGLTDRIAKFLSQENN